jgi:hypothetical protein
MTNGEPAGLATGGVGSLEMRWIIAGRLDSAVSQWFARFPAAMESREDSYLLAPYLRGLAVKVRAAGALEVKVYRGSPGIADLAARVRGRIESWQKWSFPCAPPGHRHGDPAGWMPVRKNRRISQFTLANGNARPDLPGPGKEPGCEVELTEVLAAGEAWWSLGFEATGPASSCSPRPCQAAWSSVRATPGPMWTGSEGGRASALRPNAENLRRGRSVRFIYQGTGPCRSWKVPVGPSGGRVARRTIASVPSVTVWAPRVRDI